MMPLIRCLAYGERWVYGPVAVPELPYIFHVAFCPKINCKIATMEEALAKPLPTTQAAFTWKGRIDEMLDTPHRVYVYEGPL